VKNPDSPSPTLRVGSEGTPVSASGTGTPSSLDEKNHNEKQKPVEKPISTTGELFPNGTAIELIADESGYPRLLLFDGKEPRVARRVKVRGRLYEPPNLDASLLHALTLPTKCIPYTSTRKLFAEIAQAISQASGLREPLLRPFVYFVFATWLIESLPVAPCFWVVVPATTSAAALAHVLHLLCRRALVVPELTTTGLRSLPRGLRPTLLANVAGVTRELLRALHASSRSGMYIPTGNNNVADLFCSKVVFARQPLPDPSAAGFPFEIALAPSVDNTPPMNVRGSQRLATDLQGKLLMYRLKNHAKLATPKLELAGLTAPTRDLAYTLAACIVGDDELQSQVVRFLGTHDREIQVDQAALLESTVLEALLAACHDAKTQMLSIIDLTHAVNTILDGRGEPRQVSPEITGWKLRALGLRSEFIANGRKGLYLPHDTRVRIHDLAAAYGVRTLRVGIIGETCSYCAQLRSPLTGKSDQARGATPP